MEKSEGMYLIHTREMINTNKDIYKIGRSCNLSNRAKQYPNGSKILLQIVCENSTFCEAHLLKLFKEKFIQKSYYGTEYFQGDYLIMVKEICDFINNEFFNYKNIKNIKNIKKIKKNIKNNIKMNNIIVKKNIKENDKVNNDNNDIVNVNVNNDNNDIVNINVNNDNNDIVNINVNNDNNDIGNVNVNNNNKIVINNSDRICPICNYIFEYPSRLKKHFENVIHCKKSDIEIKEYFANINNNIIIIQCNYCNKEFSRKDSLNRHLKNSQCSKYILKKS
jgi:hypothetical protein